MRDLRVRPVDADFSVPAAIRQRDRFFMTPVLTEKEQTVWFKASLQASPQLRRSIREEIRVQRLFADFERRYKPRFGSPSFIASHDNRRGFLWLLRKYWEGVYAGDMTERFGYSHSFFNHVSPRQMAAVVSDVRLMTGMARSRLSLYTHDLGWYTMDFGYYRKPFFAPLLKHPLNPGWTKDDVDRMEELLISHRAFFRRHATVFSHGDLYPNNVMISPGSSKPVVLFDWEQAHYNLPTFDAAMVYLLAWRKPLWRQEFKRRALRDLGDTKTARTAWRLAVLSLATRLTAFAFIRLTNQQPERYPRPTPDQRRVLGRLFRIWLRELNGAYTGGGS